MNSNFKAPPVYKPNVMHTAAPPVYRPHTVKQIAQPKQANILKVESRPAPPVYRPQQIGRGINQQKALQAFKLETRSAPLAYRPQLNTNLGIQQKRVEGKQGSRPIHLPRPVTSQPTALNRGVNAASASPLVSSDRGISCQQGGYAVHLINRSKGQASVSAATAKSVNAVGPPVTNSGMPRFPVLQPKLGYEFQTGWRVEPSSSLWAPVINSPFIKSQPLVQGDGWKLTSDDGEVEFIVDPPVEEGDYSRLRTIFAGIRRMTNSLVKQGDNETIDTSSLPGVTYLGKGTTIRPEKETRRSLAAKPQVTAGIRPSRMRMAMEELGDRYSKASELYEQGRGRMLRQVAFTAASIAGSEAYRGLVSTMAAYIVVSSSMRGVTSSVKDLTSLMSRTNLSVAFKYLPEAHKLDAKSKSSFKTRFLKDVLRVAAEASIALDYIQRAVINDSMKLLPPVISGLVDPETVPRTGPTVREWVEGVVDGIDKLAISVTSLSTWRTSSLSMGAMDKIEPVGSNKPGMIVELRDLTKGLAHEQWGDWAEQFLEWVTNLNSSPNTSFPERSKKQREERFKAWRQRQFQLQVENEQALKEAKQILSGLKSD